MDVAPPAFKDDLRARRPAADRRRAFHRRQAVLQEELFHTLTSLMEDGRRVVLSADRPPSALTEVDARLRSHLSAGLVCGVEPADRALRAGHPGAQAPALWPPARLSSAAARPEVLEFLADRFPGSSASWRAR